LNLSGKIKQSFAKFNLKLWPLPEHEPSGKQLNVKGGKIILFFDFSTEEEKTLLIKQIPNLTSYLENSSLITICNMSDTFMQSENEEVVFFSLFDYNLLGTPKSRLKQWLTSNEFNILISFVNNENIFCNKFISTIKADFKAGMYSTNNVKLFDLTLNQDSDDISKQLELFTHYFNKLNINK